MIEKIKEFVSKENTPQRARNAGIIASICLALTACSSKEEQYQAQLQKVQELEYALKQQSDDYHDVSTQWEIQENLKKEWADKTINQEIWYSINRTRNQDKEIAKKKEELSKAQKKLAKMKEDIDFEEAKRFAERSDVPNPDKYNYIKEEFERAEKAKENNN